MTSLTQILNAMQQKSLKLKKSIPRSQVARIIEGDELKKNHDVTNSSLYCFAAIKKEVCKEYSINRRLVLL